ncbi:DUF1223 domain-containing protein [Mucilaginibacter aquariorum]|uniref:DUF1223 domain-containing protein n=1 Tax=Mucilaginibacter aquariorum TaxID=2967225 RepID=A0ABT1T9D3_9SPHI|nr:DUF1223 domain-containing protein [Mucilaginibacter aquariorum]MCQ6961232.1 DUF1223 domain-containing protein [Mucilaginibacter aquariorum]
MKDIKAYAVILCLAIMALVSAAFINKSRVKPAIVTSGQGFAVVELFTSEGCSSCPPADELLARVQKENIGKPVYILAYHVDYWNRLGWKDIFSSADFSKRQSTYAKWLKLGGVYTPQAIVNGQTEFVGSAQGTLRNAIRTNLTKASKTQISLTVLTATKDKATLKYNTDGAADNTVLVLALVQKNTTSVIKSGENSGRTLSHIQIVNKLQNIPLGNNKTGEASIALPHNFSAQGWEVIGFVQNTQTGDISAATRAAFPQTVTANN